MSTNKEKNFISAVVYVHNAGKEIRVFLTGLCRVLDSNFEKFEIICVNDASSDDSIQEIGEFSRQTGTAVTSVINMSMFQGTELSMSAGMDLAIGDFIYEFDCIEEDYGPDLILEVYRKALEGYDIVSVVPQKTVGTDSRMFYRLFNRYSVAGAEIHQESFRIISRRAVNRIKSVNKTLVYRKAVYAGCGLKQTYLEYPNRRTSRNLDAGTRMNRIELAVDSLILFTNAVQQISLAVSISFLALTVFIGGYAWFSYFGTRKPVEGWTPIMLFLSIGFFGIFLILTIMLQYLSVILKLVYRKKQYLIESVEKLTSN